MPCILYNTFFHFFVDIIDQNAFLRDDYYSIKNGSTPNLRKVFEADARIPMDLWNSSDRATRLKIYDRLIGPLNLVGKLDDAELDYLKENKFYLMAEYLST